MYKLLKFLSVLPAQKITQKCAQIPKCLLNCLPDALLVVRGHHHVRKLRAVAPQEVPDHPVVHLTRRLVGVVHGVLGGLGLS